MISVKRNLQITAPVIDFQDLPGFKIVHYATSYEVSYSPYFEDNEYGEAERDKIIASNIRDTVNLKVWKLEVDNLDEDVSVFMRTRVHYYMHDLTTGDKTYYDTSWTVPRDLLGDAEGLKVGGVLLATPTLKVERVYSGKSGYLIVKTSPMNVFLGYGDHKYTTWEIRDSDGVLIFERKLSEDLTEIKIPVYKPDGTLLIKPTMMYQIRAIHHSSTNAKSLPGTFIYYETIVKQNQFTVTADRKMYLNKYMSFIFTLFTPNYRSVDIMIKDLNDNIKISEFGLKTLKPLVLIKGLNINQEYDIVARVELSEGVYTEWLFVGRYTCCESMVVDINTNVKYSEDYTFQQAMMLLGNMYLSAFELPEGGFVLPAPDGTNTNSGLGYYIIENDKLIYTSRIIKPSGAIGDIHTYGTQILPIHNNTLIVSRTDIRMDGDIDAGKHIIDKYLYNPLSKTFSFDGSVTRTKERGSTGISASMCYSNDVVYYIPASELSGDSYIPLVLNKLDVNTMKITKVSDLPFKANRYVSMCSLDANRFIILGGVLDTEDLDNPVRTNHDVYIYNVKDNTFINVLSIKDKIPDTMYNLTAVLRKDGRVIIFNNSENDTAKDQSTYVIDLQESKLFIYENDYPDNRYYTKTITCNNGNIIRISSHELQPQMAYCYKVEGHVSVSNNGEVYDNIITDLVVPANEIVTISSPYRYRSIKIEGSVLEGTSGKLIWPDGSTTRVFDANTKFINKSEMVYNDEQDSIFNDPDKTNIFILDGVKIIVRSDNKPI